MEKRTFAKWHIPTLLGHSAFALGMATIPLHLLLSKMQPEQFGTSILAV